MVAERQMAISLISALCVIVSPALPSAEWMGHLATLFQAQVACANSNSKECLPYIAEAVAVAQLLTEQVKVPIRKDEAYGVVFHGGHVESCSITWLQSMNGTTL